MQELKKEEFQVAFEAEIINKRMRGYRPVRFNCPRKHYADQRKTTSFTLWGIERGGLELSIWLTKKKKKKKSVLESHWMLVYTPRTRLICLQSVALLCMFMYK